MIKNKLWKRSCDSSDEERNKDKEEEERINEQNTERKQNNKVESTHNFDHKAPHHYK